MLLVHKYNNTSVAIKHLIVFGGIWEAKLSVNEAPASPDWRGLFCFSAAASDSEGLFSLENRAHSWIVTQYSRFFARNRCDRCCNVLSPTQHFFNKMKPHLYASTVLTAYGSINSRKYIYLGVDWQNWNEYSLMIGIRNGFVIANLSCCLLFLNFSKTTVVKKNKKNIEDIKVFFHYFILKYSIIFSQYWSLHVHKIYFKKTFKFRV